MPKHRKTDNHALTPKLDLRRHFLREYHAQTPGPRVIDCCQGDGRIWSQLGREFALGSYWGMDVKPKKGRLKIDSSRVLAQPGWVADVVDVDSYGSPWAHWCALLPNVPQGQALTVFLTLGTLKGVGGANAPTDELRECGIVFRAKGWPRTLLASDQVREHVLMRMLSLPLRHGLRVMECREATTDHANARYFGMRLEPITPPRDP